VLDDSAIAESELATAATPSPVKKKQKSVVVDRLEPAVETDPVASGGKSTKKKRHRKEKEGDDEVVVKEELLVENIENRSDNLTLSSCDSSLSVVTSSAKKKVKKEKL
jgi:hypothetical protein